MEQTPGLCSPDSSTFTAFVKVSVESGSSTLVTFAAIPMISGAIPIKIRLYDFNNNREPDAIEKSLNVWVSHWIECACFSWGADGYGTGSLGESAQERFSGYHYFMGINQ